jgi:hypothetical protein
LVEDRDFWPALVMPVLADRSEGLTVLEVLSTARLFGNLMDGWLDELRPIAPYESWMTGLLATEPEPVSGELRITWQPMLQGTNLQEWYRCVPMGSGLSDTSELSLAQLLDFKLVLDPTYSLYNAEGECVFYTQKPFRLFDVLIALCEQLFYFDGPNERSVYIDVTRQALRRYYESERLQVV